MVPLITARDVAKLARVAKVAKGLGVTRAMRERTVISSGSTHAVGRSNKGSRVKPDSVCRAVSVVRRARIEAAAVVTMLEAVVAATPMVQAT